MVRLAIIGLGAVTRNLHLPAYARLRSKVKVVAGCDPDPSARQWVQQRWRLPEVFSDPLEMLERSQPDIVSVCTPPALHREHCLLALEHGCHVFCEKPFANDLSQVDEIIRAAESAQRLLVVNNQFPCMRMHAQAKSLIGSPQFGRLLYLHAWHTLSPSERTEAGWRGQMQRRLCFEFGIHVFELVRFFFDDTPVRLLAHMPNPLRASHCDIVNVIALEFADGRAASILLDRLSKGPEHYLDVRLDGEFATIHTSIGGRARLQVGIHTRERRPFFDLGIVQGGQAVLQQGNRSRVIAKDPVNPFAAATSRHFESFLHALQHGGQPPGNARDNRNTLAMVLAAYESADSARWVELAQYLQPQLTA